MFSNAKNFNQDISQRDIKNVTTVASIFSGAGLSLYNYNQILSGWSIQNVHTGLNFSATPAQYGGCNLTNREAGITGREKLIAEKGRTITDGGLADCVPIPPTTPSVGGNGGGGGSLSKDKCPNGDNSPSYYDGTCDSTQPLRPAGTSPDREGNAM
jgi:hypothetical protein